MKSTAGIDVTRHKLFIDILKFKSAPSARNLYW
jgi:hypothetical protein